MMNFKRYGFNGLLIMLICLTGCATPPPTQPLPAADPQLVKLHAYLVNTKIGVTRVKNTSAFKLTLPTRISFQKNSTQLNPKFFNNLTPIAQLLKTFPEMLLKIEGHTDIYGTLRYNQVLAEKRAKVVAQYFYLQGIPKKRIQTAGFGVTQPIASNKNQLGRIKNRRIEILIYSL